MLFKKKFLHIGKKTTVTCRKGRESDEKKTITNQDKAPVRKISDREIALGYMLW